VVSFYLKNLLQRKYLLSKVLATMIGGDWGRWIASNTRTSKIVQRKNDLWGTKFWHEYPHRYRFGWVILG